MSDNIGHRKLGEILLDPKTKEFVLVTNFGTFKLVISEETPVTERQRLSILDVLNGRKA